jgi:hypothetical protein
MAEYHLRPLPSVGQGVLLLASFGMLWWQELPSPVRPVYVVAYLLVAPGYALLPSLGRGHRLFQFLLAVAVGATLAIGLSTVMSETGIWRVDTAIWVTITLVVVSVLARMWHGGKATSATAAGGSAS